MSTSFILPVLIDSPQRFSNWELNCEILKNLFPDAEIITVSPELTKPTFLISPNAKHLFETEKLFWKTDLINYGVKMAANENIAILDVDLVFEPETYKRSFEHGKNALCIGYNGTTNETSQQAATLIRQHNFHPESLYLLKDHVMYSTHSNSVGGATWTTKSLFESVGGMNMSMISWGFEDNEFFARLVRLKKEVLRSPGPAYHLAHPRGINSCDANPKLAENKKILYDSLELTDKQYLGYVAKLQEQFKKL